MARFLACQNPDKNSYIVCAFPLFSSKHLIKRAWSESDTSFMFSRGTIRFNFLICEDIRNEEISQWVVPEFKRQMQNYLFLYLYSVSIFDTMLIQCTIPIMMNIFKKISCIYSGHQLIKNNTPESPTFCISTQVNFYLF